MNSALLLRFSTSSKISLMTLGMMPKSSSSTPTIYPDPMVNVLPEPVYPYASIVALKPRKQPSTRFLTHSSKTTSYWESMPKHLSYVNNLSLPIITSFSFSRVCTQIADLSLSYLPMRGLTLSATLTEHALESPVSAKKPFGFGFVSSSYWSAMSTI